MPGFLLAHIRCTTCRTPYIHAGSWPVRCLCFTCETVSWQVEGIWHPGRTPWICAPWAPPERLFSLHDAPGFLAQLVRSAAWSREDPTDGPYYVVPGLYRRRRGEKVTYVLAPAADN